MRLSYGCTFRADNAFAGPDPRPGCSPGSPAQVRGAGPTCGPLPAGAGAARPGQTVPRTCGRPRRVPPAVPRSRAARAGGQGTGHASARGRPGTRSHARPGAPRRPRGRAAPVPAQERRAARPGPAPAPAAAPTESGGGASAFMCDPEPTGRGRGGGGRNRSGRRGRPRHRPGKRCGCARFVPGRSPPRGARGGRDPRGQCGARPGRLRRVVLLGWTTFPSEPHTEQADPARVGGVRTGTSFPAIPRAPEVAARRFRGGGPGQRRQAAAAGGAPGGDHGRDRARD